jgi:endonuclease III
MELGIRSYPEELGLDLRKPGDRFKWFLASLLFGRRISAEIALRTFREFERRGYTTPERVLEAGWHRLVEALDEGGYVRYDYSTADRLLEICGRLKEEGGLERLHSSARDARDLERRLMDFRGIGPVTVSIFLRELRGIWEKADPPLSPLAKEVAGRLGMRGEERMKELEPRLVRLALEYCKRRRCPSCPVRGRCREGGA